MDDRRLHAGHDAARLLGLAGLRRGASLSLGVDQLGAALDHRRGVAALDRVDEGAVDQPQLEIGPAVPHRERRGLDDLRQGVDRGLGLPQPESDLCAIFLRRADVDTPQQEGPGRLTGRRGPAADVEYPPGPLRVDLA